MRILLGAALFLLAGPALATDFSKQLLDGDEKPICMVEAKDTACPTDKILTLRVAVRNALFFSFDDERGLSGDEKFKRAELAQGLVGTNEAKLKAEDVALMKRLVAKLYGPLIVYQAWLALDPPK